MESVAGSPWNQWPDAAGIRTAVRADQKRQIIPDDVLH